MIIKSIFRRYERWNPVHPTYGAFWGIGVGIGCGIGWGPGFGPEVIGYVGAGCGAGFNVGFTLLGAGIGLPINYIYTVPYSAFMATKRSVLDVAQASLGNRSGAVDGWGDSGARILDVQQNIRASLSGFKIKGLTENIGDLPDVKSILVSNVEHITDGLQKVGRSFWDRDSKSRRDDPSNRPAP